MTSKTIAIEKTDREFEPYPEFPPRDDMQNWNYLYSKGQAAGLALYLDEEETTTVRCETPVGPTLDNHSDKRIPDLMVSMNSRPDLIEEHGGYAIDRQGKPPDFVLEVASKTTGTIDYTDKRVDYERYEVTEYWRFDSTGGEYHDAPLAGDRLVYGRYQPIEIEWVAGEDILQGYSEALGLYVCWELGELRFYDPRTDSYVPNHYDEASQRETESERAEQETARADRETARAEQEAARADRETARAKQETARADRESARAEQEAARADREAARAEQEAAARRQAEAEVLRFREIFGAQYEDE